MTFLVGLQDIEMAPNANQVGNSGEVLHGSRPRRYFTILHVLPCGCTCLRDFTKPVQT